VADWTTSRIIVPRVFLPVISVEMHVPVTALGDSFLAFRRRYLPAQGRAVGAAHLGSGWRAASMPRSRTLPPHAGGRRWQRINIVPVVVDAASGLWLDRLDAAPVR